jgi:hypothetical protein
MSKDGARLGASAGPCNARRLRKCDYIHLVSRNRRRHGKRVGASARNVYFVLSERARRGGGAASRVARAMAVFGW